MEGKESRQPAAGELYRHFKGNLYQVMGVAKHSETGEPMVVYQALYGSYDWYVRPLAMFFGSVDAEKYPEYAGKCRFERVDRQTLAASSPVSEKASKTVQETMAGTLETNQAAAVRTLETISEKEENVSGAAGAQEEETVREELLMFLDAETVTEKLEVLRQIRGKLDDELLTNIELSLDLMPLPTDSLERRLDLVEQNLSKRARYEGGRLR